MADGERRAGPAPLWRIWQCRDRRPALRRSYCAIDDESLVVFFDDIEAFQLVTLNFSLPSQQGSSVVQLPLTRIGTFSQRGRGRENLCNDRTTFYGPYQHWTVKNNIWSEKLFVVSYGGVAGLTKFSNCMHGGTLCLLLGDVCCAPQRARVGAIEIDFQHCVVELARGRCRKCH